MYEGGKGNEPRKLPFAMKTQRSISSQLLCLLFLHIGNAAFFVFIELFCPVARHAFLERFQPIKLPLGFDFFTDVFPDWLFLLLLPSIGIWYLLRRKRTLIRYFAVFVYNVQVFVVILTIYAFYLCVLSLPYYPLL